MLPAWRGGGPPPERELVWHFPYYHPETGFEAARGTIGVDEFAVSRTLPHSAIRVGEWKLLHFYEDDRDELYHLATDSSEQRNLVTQEPARARDLRARLDRHLGDVRARLPTLSRPD
jgi:uncharacterized sulfatase